LEPGLRAAQVAGGGATAILAGNLMVAGLTNPVTAPIVLTVGGLLLLNAAYGAYVRYEETFETSNRGDLGQAIFATVSDNVGATAYVIKWTGRDPFTGKPVEMGDFEFGVNVTASLMATKFTIQQLARVKNSSGQLVWKVVDKIERQIASIDNWLTARNATPQTVLAGSATNPPMKPVLNPGPEAQIKTETFSFAEGKAKVAAYVRGIKFVFRVMRHGDMPTPRPANTESHHGVMSAWMEAHFSDYVAADAPGILMPKDQHHQINSFFASWRKQKRAEMGGTFRWEAINEQVFRTFSEAAFDHVNMPQRARTEYWQQFDAYKATLTPIVN
jgi:hypothetical protein